MRLLVACSNSKRQFDASALQTHDRFRYRCGKSLEVPEPKLSSCSSDREAQAKRNERVKKVIEPLGVPYEAHQQQPIPVFELLDYIVGLFRQ